MNAETGPRKSPPETTCPRRDQEGPESIAEIPAQKAYLNLTGNYPIPKDCVVGTTGIEPVTPTMSTQCVDGKYSKISDNYARNIRFCSRLDHGFLGHILGREALHHASS